MYILPLYWRRRISLLSSLLLLLYGVSFSLAVSREFPLEYDGNGNLVSDGTFYYDFDGWNRLRRVRLGDASGEGGAFYAYDGSGRRILKVVFHEDGTNTTTLYPFKDYVRVINSSGTYDTKYVYDNQDTLLARQDPDGSKYYYHPNHLGSTDIVTDESGEVVEEYEYLPYGAELAGGNERYT
ncbi:MAG: hypothetical protein GF334_13690, partial [Candidatus Altiarchaeales archaeon]|nr:hypothetical protein [Candidatus Altiarchaeales archaeon]